MSESSREERERLKEEYKDHYRKIRDTSEKLRSSRYAKKASDALRQMQSDELLGSVDEFLGKVRYKMASIEARLDLAMDDLINSDAELEAERDEELKKQKAKESLQQIKREMGMLYDDLEEQAEQLQVKKTVGPDREDSENREQ
ncbi:hypothetical protein DYD21_15730 [Rhodohalobacter sp. SW132]|uniref:hypothetical protein n=1 Tax=Rhodohalobacter sp. SW132 TaxID=2293433 RepID=UPI000E26B50C|nr:hypothetical protein [Rhodohalobacter sp. SW132]REL24972.1 hypothetical protein DYD21_15730 [Rhodohalobacter sp. SW132]